MEDDDKPVEVETDSDGGTDEDLHIEAVTSDHDTVETRDSLAEEKSVVTDDNDRFVTAPEPELVTEETKDADASDKAKAAGDAAAEKGSRSRYLTGGGYQVTRADGTKIVLSEDEVQRVARSRIDRSTRKYRDLEREMQAQQTQHQKELDELKAATAELRGDKPAPTKGSPKPKMDDYDTVDEWDDAKDAWRDAQAAEKANAKPEATPEDRAQFDAFISKVNEMKADGAARYTDFDTVVNGNKDAPFDPVMCDFLLKESDDSTAMFYHYGQHTDDAQEVRQMLADDDVKGAIRALAKAEARLDAAPGSYSESSDDEPATPGKGAPAAPTAQISRAPKPITPVSGSAPVKSNPETESYDSYAARRRKEVALRNR